MTDILTLNEINNLESTECSCDECRQMYSHSRPCWGTPDEIRKLIENGFANQLMNDNYEDDYDQKIIDIITPALVGYEGRSAPEWPIGRCTFFNNDGLCDIHNMKPVEGRVTDHNRDDPNIHESIVYLWKSKKGKDIVKQWKGLNGY